MTDSDIVFLKKWFDGETTLFPEGDQFLEIKNWFSKPSDIERNPFVCAGDHWSEVLSFLENIK